jgi:hypothetical protein
MVAVFLRNTVHFKGGPESGFDLSRTDSSPIVLQCDDPALTTLRVKIEEKLRTLGYDVHDERRLSKLRGVVNDWQGMMEPPNDKFRQIADSYVYVVVVITPLNE